MIRRGYLFTRLLADNYKLQEGAQEYPLHCFSPYSLWYPAKAACCNRVIFLKDIEALMQPYRHERYLFVNADFIHFL